MARRGAGTYDTSMDIPWVRGRAPRQAHVGVPDGTVEEEFAREGFSGRYAHLYRAHAPVAWTRIEGPLRPRAFDSREVLTTALPGTGDWVAGRTRLLENEDVCVGIGRLDAPMPYFFRNADADELLFVHEGRGRIETDFGPLAYAEGDYVVLPRGTTHRICPTSPTMALVVEATSELTIPDRGMLGQHALFDPAVLRVPSPEPSLAKPSSTGEHELQILRAGEITKVYYRHAPIDVVGWKGTLAAYALAVKDIRPVSSDRYHLPPSAHTTFVAKGAVVCTFAPRPLENGDPEAMKVPFFHMNVDYDEVLFYHAGDFFSRDGIGAGMLTLHPQGIHHGPQPRARARAAGKTHTDEIAVMIDTRRPLRATAQARGVERADYWKSWSEGPTPEETR